VDSSYRNNFFVKYIKNYNILKTPKIKEIKAKSLKNIMYYDTDHTYDSIYSYQPSTVTLIAKLPSVSAKALEITFYTDHKLQDFCIKSLEMSKIKVKQV
jgi:saccharopine dehydrogenase-like NADP-dependent oxidoreductase